MGGHKKGRKPIYDESFKNIRICIWDNKNSKGKVYGYAKILRYRKNNQGGLKTLELSVKELKNLFEHSKQMEI